MASSDRYRQKKISHLQRSLQKEETERKLDDLSGSDNEDIDFSKEIRPIGYYINDREKMIEEMFSVVKNEKLRKMLPPILKGYSLEEIKADCLVHLLGMSKKRIYATLQGRDLNSSSDSESDTTNSVLGSDSSEEPQITSSTQVKSDVEEIDDTLDITISKNDLDALIPDKKTHPNTSRKRVDKSKPQEKPSKKIKTERSPSLIEISDDEIIVKKKKKKGEKRSKKKSETKTKPKPKHSKEKPKKAKNDSSSESSDKEDTTEDGSVLVDSKKGKSLLEILELEMRARAIRALLEANTSALESSSKTATESATESALESTSKVKQDPDSKESPSPDKLNTSTDDHVEESDSFDVEVIDDDVAIIILDDADDQIELESDNVSKTVENDSSKSNSAEKEPRKNSSSDKESSKKKSSEKETSKSPTEKESSKESSSEKESSKKSSREKDPPKRTSPEKESSKNSTREKDPPKKTSPEKESSKKSPRENEPSKKSPSSKESSNSNSTSDLSIKESSKKSSPSKQPSKNNSTNDPSSKETPKNDSSTEETTPKDAPEKEISIDLTSDSGTFEGDMTWPERWAESKGVKEIIQNSKLCANIRKRMRFARMLKQKQEEQQQQQQQQQPQPQPDTQPENPLISELQRVEEGSVDQLQLLKLLDETKQKSDQLGKNVTESEPKEVTESRHETSVESHLQTLARPQPKTASTPKKTNDSPASDKEEGEIDDDDDDETNDQVHQSNDYHRSVSLLDIGVPDDNVSCLIDITDDD